MEHSQDSSAAILAVIDNMLSAALREVRRARALGPVPVEPKRDRDKSRSNTERCLDVLVKVARPLHVTALVDALGRDGVKTSRDSLVSALSKRLAPHGPFVRTAANTFGLAGRDKVED